MAPLAPIPGSDISALYDTPSRQLILSAVGTLPGIWFTPFFKQEPFAGGLRFSLQAFTGGFHPPPKRSFDIAEKFQIDLPIPHFNNKSVLVETGLGRFTIDIKYTGFGSDSVPSSEPDGNNFRDVLPPIQKFLTGDAELFITAQIPKTEPSGKASVEPSFNPQFLKLVDSIYEDGAINWTFQWAELPLGEDQNPQLIEIITTVSNGYAGPPVQTWQTRQGYSVHLVLLQK
ncbi:uncharacterized protein CTRU02_206665 [Colletotrichum truncatum]|uniref:Uncharacterized protein n=1 Tax=Colletotrichum truncatum TaxID=5467 RepID=A0ACC3Z7L9_COLTU|nr:uncharacterized protein CTRU02_13785 [Colletotrichum truncatum]KAF6782959.1 hypothetical protein CTRU02_13785 [Colletotrichum truncatum]